MIMETFTNEEAARLYDCYLQAVNLRRQAEAENTELLAFIELKGLTDEWQKFRAALDKRL
jgi:hypothetical protein